MDRERLEALDGIERHAHRLRLELEVGAAPHQRRHRLREVGAGERLTQAEVRTVTERGVVRVAARDVEGVRAVESGWVRM